MDRGTGNAKDACVRSGGGEPSAVQQFRLQLWKRITEPLADPAFVGGVLSQTRAARENRRPPDPMTVTYHKIAEIQNVCSGIDGKAGIPLRKA
jgi:hypothetical protein